MVCGRQSSSRRPLVILNVGLPHKPHSAKRGPPSLERVPYASRASPTVDHDQLRPASLNLAINLPFLVIDLIDSLGYDITHLERKRRLR